jgi:hypothetical protein
VTFLLAALGFLRAIPPKVWIALAVIGAAWWAVSWKADRDFNRGVVSTETRYEAELKRVKEQQVVVVEKVVVEYRDRVKVIKEKGDEIIQAIPVYVTGDCGLSPGWRVLHDAAASGELPQDPAGAVAAASPVDEAAAAETVARNYEIARETAARLLALQAIVTQLGGTP